MTSETGRPRRPLWLRLGVSLGAVVFTLLLAEIGFRIYYGVADVPVDITFGSESEEWKRKWVQRHRRSGTEIFYSYDEYHPLLGWMTKPDLEKVVTGSQPPVSTNAQGFRSPYDFEEEKRDGVVRIVTVGDSFTFGEEAEDEDVWPVQLEEQLDGAEVYNLGIHGYGTDQQLRMLELEGLKYRPDVVIVGFFVENILRNGLSFRDYAKPRFELEGDRLVLTDSPVPAPEELLAEPEEPAPPSYLVYHLRSRLAGRLSGTDLDDIAEKKGLFPLTRAILRRMNEVTNDAGAKLLVVVIPALHWPMPRVEASIAEWGRESGFEVVHLRDAFDAAEKQYGKSMYSQLHHSPLGNFVTARVVREALVDAGWVTAPDGETVQATQNRLRRILGEARIRAQDHHNLGKRAFEAGKVREAIRRYRAGLELQPRSAAMAHELAWILATSPNEKVRNGEEAVRLAETACDLLDYRFVAPLHSLAAAYAEAGRFEDAVRTIETAQEIAKAEPHQATLYDLEGKLALYRSGQPFRESSR